MEGIGGEDFYNIPTLGVKITDPNSSPKIAIRIVYGATETIPLRSLGYIAPGLVYLESLQKLGLKTSQLQIISALHISSRLDSLDHKKAEHESQLFTTIASDYVRFFFPHLVESVVFLEDQPLAKNSTIRNELISNAVALRNIDETGINNAIKEKAENNGARRMFAFYAGAHLLFHDANIEESMEPSRVNQPTPIQPDTIISIGGYQEQDFYKIRHALKPHLDSRYHKLRTLQLFTKHRVPPYYMARGGDFSLDDAIHGRRHGEIARTASHDLEYLENVSGKRASMYRFMEIQRRKAK